MKKNTASDNVHTLHTDFYMPQLNRHRTIYVYLPPDYHHTHKRYPVIYAQDGQNLFNEATAFHREWKIDKTLNQLQKKKAHGAIVVGITNGGHHRIDEYAAWKRGRMGGGEATNYVNFLADTLKPHIDHHFRTLPDAQNNTLLGSSMGGLFALYGAVQRQDVFGKAAAFSPSFWFSPQIYDFVQKHVSVHQKIYIAGSKMESQFMHQSLQGMYWALHNGGVPNENLHIALRDKGKHNEVFWREDFKKMYKWLFN